MAEELIGVTRADWAKIQQALDDLRALKASVAALARNAKGLQPGEDNEVWVKVTGNETGGGKYTGQILYPPTEFIDPGTTLTELDIGEIEEGEEDVLVMNTWEVDESTHNIETSSVPIVFKGTIRGLATDGRLAIAIDGLVECPP